MSLAPLFDSPSAPPPALANRSAFSQIGSCACKTYTVGNWTGLECNAGRCAGVNVTDFDFMGYTMRTAEGWRYTLWAPMNATTQRVDFNGTLYDEVRAFPLGAWLASLLWSTNSALLHLLLQLYNQTADVGLDFDFDEYAVNVAQDFPALAAQFRSDLIAAVLSWY